MRPTYPAPISDRGFTLLEVILALALCVILAGVVASTLGTALRAERTGTQRLDTLGVLDRVMAAQTIDPSATNLLAAAGPDWLVASEDATTGPETNPVPWTVYEISSRQDASLRARAAVRP